MLSSSNRKDLEVKGYTILENVLNPEECDKYRSQYEQWLAQFKEGEWPESSKSLIQRYRVGHMEPTWAVRLKTKGVFAQIWKTEELLTSFDAIAIGRPPESGSENFYTPGQHWLHSDQQPERMGLHAYQGAVYLEECEEDDWTFEILEGSHLCFDKYYKESEYALQKRKAKPGWRLRTLREEDINWYTQEGCTCVRKRVPVPKGGMVLWDSRLIHANARPIKGRKNPERWRYVVFVCMAPAAWADGESLEIKKQAYNDLRMTTHWPCDDVGLFSEHLPSYAVKDVEIPTKLPDIALTDEAKRLAGVLSYGNVSETSGNGVIPPKPKWMEGGAYHLETCKGFVREGKGNFYGSTLTGKHGGLKMMLAAAIIAIFALFLKYISNQI